jgi:hypothetical protein
MNDEPAGFFKRKTTWAALAGIFGAAAGAATGTVSPGEALTAALNAVFALTLRSAVSKIEK